MLRFQPWGGKWWNKPLVDLRGHIIPAELAVLAAEAGPTESGAWLNSTSTTTGMVDLLRDEDADGAPVFQTQRESLPAFVSKILARLYEASGLRKGCPDLVIWDSGTQAIRLVEVKCPHWDRPSAEQEKFLDVARELGIPASIIEWEFAPGALVTD